MSNTDEPNVRITIIAADGLCKRDVFGFPDPFAVATINGAQTRATSVIKKTLNPYWNEEFDYVVNEDSILAVVIFDQKKFLKKDQGFLGVINVRIAAILDLDSGGDEMLTRDLKKSVHNVVVHGKVIINIRTLANVASQKGSQRSGNALHSPKSQLQQIAPKMEDTLPSYSASTNQSSYTSQPSIVHLSATSEPLADMRRPTLTEVGSLSSRSTASEDALSAWNRKFSTRQVRLAREEPEPFSPGRRLGGGGIGVVHEVNLDGISLALKRTYAKRLTEYELNEIKILGQITEKRHKHIVELIGSYIHRQRGVYELGLLIWPVAHCDLAVFLQDVDLLGQWTEHERIEGIRTRTEDLDLAVESLSTMTGFRIPWSLKGALEKSGTRLYEMSLGILRSNFGCITNAVAWLHQQGIRHKDLKPSQILLSSDGLWLTDFGWSKDISELTQSATDGGQNITLKYQAPERARKQLCGRPEDIFSLGCIFIEMAFQLARPILMPAERVMPWKQKGWYFQANLNEVRALLLPLQSALDTSWGGPSVAELIPEMLAFTPSDRPSIDEVLRRLAFSAYLGECCASEVATRISSLGNVVESQLNTMHEASPRYLTPPSSFGVSSAVPRLLPRAIGIAQSNSDTLYIPNQATQGSRNNRNTGSFDLRQRTPERDIVSRPGVDHSTTNINKSAPGTDIDTFSTVRPANPNISHLSPESGFITNSAHQDLSRSTSKIAKQQLENAFNKLNITEETLIDRSAYYQQSTVFGTKSADSYPSTNPFRSTTPSNGSNNPFRQQEYAPKNLETHVNHVQGRNTRHDLWSLQPDEPALQPSLARFDGQRTVHNDSQHHL
ncbi:kinase-like domain-containing protein [Pyrenochaeta sp. MPI-SDFR-AT-0127]|nr:kinase-like domain-containing protein [Pyrenochaeta sp. MPI-SDFR-AT-0127]